MARTKKAVRGREKMTSTSSSLQTTKKSVTVINDGSGENFKSKKSQKRKGEHVKSPTPEKLLKVEGDETEQELNSPYRTLVIKYYPDITKPEEIKALSPDIEQVVMKDNGSTRLAIIEFKSEEDVVKNIRVLQNQTLHGQPFHVRTYSRCETDPAIADPKRLYVRLYGSSSGDSLKNLMKRSFPELRHVACMSKECAIVSFKKETDAKEAMEKYRNSFDFVVSHAKIKTSQKKKTETQLDVNEKLGDEPSLSNRKVDPRRLYVRGIDLRDPVGTVRTQFPDALSIDIGRNKDGRVMKYAFLTFETEEQCQKALEENDGQFEVLRNRVVEKNKYLDPTVLSLEKLTEETTEEFLKQQFMGVEQITFSGKDKSMCATLSFPSVELSKNAYNTLKDQYPNLYFATISKETKDTPLATAKLETNDGDKKIREMKQIKVEINSDESLNTELRTNDDDIANGDDQERMPMQNQNGIGDCKDVVRMKQIKVEMNDNESLSEELINQSVESTEVLSALCSY